MNFDSLEANAVLETADCGALAPIELMNTDKISAGIERLASLSGYRSELAATTANSIAKMISDAPSWLPFASESYQVSANIKDYVLVPVNILPSDLPNRNMVGFPYTELSSWSPRDGMISYQTWKGKPTHIEHLNRDWTRAKGAIMDVAMQPMHGRQGNLWKVLALCGFDRSKDAALANDILTGARSNYSMGAMVSQYSCSVCGCRTELGSGKEGMACGKTHIDPKSGRFKTFKINGENILGHYNAHGIQGFEVSSVGTPAWPSAVTDVKQHLRY